MDIRQLKTFIEVSKLGSFSKAAEKLFLTQPTVTNHVQSIEKELDAVLLNRMSKGVTNTEAGDIVYSHSIDIINHFDSMRYQIEEHKGKIEGRLEIASSSVPRRHLLPQLIHGFRKQHPLVTFSIMDVDSSKVVENILNGYIDFGFVGAVFENPNLEYRGVMDDCLVFVTPSDVYSEKKEMCNLDIEAIISQPLILREEGSGTGKVLKDALQLNGIQLNQLKISAIVADTETIKKMISLGSGSSFLSYKDVFDESGKKLVTGNVFRIEKLHLDRKFHLVFHKKRKLSPLGEAFKEFALNYSTIR
jgi:DNA-binding transcriptional LysR family regulator